MSNYFGRNAVYLKQYFRCRFRMSLVLHITNSVKEHDWSFEQRRICTGMLGHSTEEKVTVALRMMAYGVPTYFIDDNLAMRENNEIF